MSELQIRETVPETGHDLLKDMLSEATSLRTKAWAARALTEQMVSVFLYQDRDQKSSQKPSLGEMIDAVKNKYGEEILSVIRHIKHIGDKASHYAKDNIIKKEDVDKSVENTLNLFSIILTSECKSRNLLKLDDYSFYIFSTLYPSVREKVLRKLIDFDSILNNDLQKMLFKKYGMAAAKAGRYKQFQRVLDRLLKKEKINDEIYTYMKEWLPIYDSQLAYLPTANDILTCRRNFENAINVIKYHNQNDELYKNRDLINENSDLIKIIKKLLY